MRSLTASATVASLVAAAAAGAFVVAPSGTRAASGGCNPSGSKTILADRSARIYSLRDGDPARGFALWGCAYSAGKQITLDAPDQIYAFLPPALHLNRSVVGFGFDLCDGDCRTTVTAVDLTTGADINAGPASASTRVKIGSLRVRSNGSVAWIACPEHQRRDLTASRRPNCVRAGSLDSVYRRRVGSRTRELLDRGRAIDPSSLSLTGTTLSWLHNGRKHTAPLR
jgi:hypothetical protein